jgi:hypothetical protein
LPESAYVVNMLKRETQKSMQSTSFRRRENSHVFSNAGVDSIETTMHYHKCIPCMVWFEIETGER